MTNTQKVLWAIVVIIVLGGLYWWWSSSQGSVPASTAAFQSSASTATTTGAAASAPTTASVTFDGSSFSPASVTIAEGGTVTWTSVNGPAWIASDPHPIHNGYDGTTMQQHCAPGYAGAAPFDECGSGTTWSFTFNKVGTWGYHDHLDAGVRGSVTVVAQ